MPTLRLRPWQVSALAALAASADVDFLAVATPGSGKTTFALTAAARAFEAGEIDQLVVVCPSDHLRTQWADAAAAFGLPLEPSFSNRDPRISPEFCGIITTYAQVAAAPEVHRGGVSSARTFVIFDEIHHAGYDRSWGDALAHAYTPAVRRLALSGTPWRSDTAPIPFVRYELDTAGAMRSRCDYTYGYGPALADGVVRPVVFMAYSGTSRWRDCAGSVLEATLDAELPRAVSRQAWRTALDPAGEWVSAVLEAADARLTSVRAAGMPDAGGLVLASTQAHARSYAELLEGICGEKVVVVLSDEPASSARIEAFATSRSRWMCSVKMVSEGVDIPRLAVGVYATNVSAPLFFAQAVGRFVRARSPQETASVFLPSVPPLLALAASLESERDHVLFRAGTDDDGAEEELDDAALAQANRVVDETLTEEGSFAALEASGHFDRVVFGGSEHGSSAAVGSASESSWLTLPGLLDPADLAASVAARARLSASSVGSSWLAPGSGPLPLHRRAAEVRRELHRLVSRVARVSGMDHSSVHAQLRAVSGGPPNGSATLAQLEYRLGAAQEMLSPF